MAIMIRINKHNPFRGEQIERVSFSPEYHQVPLVMHLQGSVSRMSRQSVVPSLSWIDGVAPQIADSDVFLLERLGRLLLWQKVSHASICKYTRLNNSPEDAAIGG